MYQNIFFILIFSVFLGYTGADEVIDNGPQGQRILLKQKFTQLARHLTKENRPDGKQRRLYRRLLSSALQRSLNFLGQTALDHMGIRNFAQKVIIKGDIPQCFLGSYIESFSADMAEYAIDQNPFSYNSESNPIYGAPLLPFSYQEGSAARIRLTTYTFLVIFLETLDDLHDFLKDDATFEENKKSIFPELKLKIQTEFASIQEAVKEVWDSTNTLLTEAISTAQEDYKYTKESFFMWAQDPGTPKEDLVKLLEELHLNYKALARNKLWSPL